MPSSLPTLPVTPSLPLLTTLLDHSPYGVIAYQAIRDTNGTVVDYQTRFYNQQVLVITGHTEEQMTQQTLFERAPYMREHAEDLRRVVDKQIPYEVDELLPSNNRWFLFDNRPLEDGFFTTFIDIDDNKRAQQQLNQQQQLLQGVINATDNFIAYCEAVRDQTGEIVDFVYRLTNRFLTQRSDVAADQIIGHRMTTYFPSVKQLGLFQRFAEVVRTGKPESFEFQYQADGYDAWYLISTAPLKEGIVLSFKNISALKQASVQLQQQNELVEGVLSASDNGVIVYKAMHNDTSDQVDFQVVLINDAALRFTGYPREQVVGSLVTDLFPHTKQIGMWHQYEQVYKTGETFRGRHYYANLNKWFDVTISKLEDRLVATFNDISQLYLATQQLQEQARLFDGVLDNITNGLSVLEAVRDESGAIIDVRYVRVSQAILNDTGLRADQLLSRTMSTVFPGVKNTTYWTAFLRAFDTGEPQHFEVKYAFDGFDNYTDNWVTRLDDNRIISVYSIINEQKQAEAQARQQAALLQTVLNSCPIPIALFEAIRNSSGQIVDFRYLLQNDTNARLVGLPNVNATNKTMLEVLPILKPLGIFDEYVRVVETGQSKRLEQQFTDSLIDGWFDISVVKQEDGIVITTNDLTLLHETLQRAEQLVNELKLSNRNLEQFAYIASHDMQEPLRKIQSFGNLLLDYYSSSIPEDGQNMLRRMQSAADRMSQLIRDLLAYSRLSIDLEPSKPVSLQQILLEIKSDLEIIIREKNAQITLAHSSNTNLPTLAGNASQLRQLFQNLLSNALKFVSPSTTPIISVQARSVSSYDLPTTIVNRTKRSWVAIDITDNGIGFDEKYQDQIFQLFERLHGRNEYNGTGIGLAVCRKVAENHGGTITVRSQPGQGTTFTVYLPESERAKA
ncbi:ATP-binding protein [Spirosoma aerolatum]|uniref:ATP-binding protein n=1 Tax=Spirosoma aerolatum TaxID=1211326 RepID=UPI0009AC37EC|nr:ATP-binding protein [Spirosoma aerolatum]